MADFVIEITIGAHRKDKQWQRKKYNWTDFCERLADPWKGKETYREYMALDKDRQDELKDVGGFVGGLLNGTRRKKDAVISRTLITLDLDHMTEEQGRVFWNRANLLLECRMCMYSTRKHHPDSPRLRLIIPLSRPVSVEEYEAAARRLAGLLGINMFDPTTFQAERMMFWPSHSAGAVYVFKQAPGDPVDPDWILGLYGSGEAWKNASLWPVTDRERKDIKTTIGVLGDPLAKHGIIGAFCRTYDIPQAIDEFLKNTYLPATDGRYSYAFGSTSAGALLYGNESGKPVFLFSHHGTDPCSARLVNAFDMVRLHKFGDLDKRMEEGTEVVKLPSYLAMCEYAALQSEVVATIMNERMESAKDAFKDVMVLDERAEDGSDEGIKEVVNRSWDDMTDRPGPVSEDEVINKWIKRMDVEKKSGNPRSTINNVLLILENDPHFKGQLYYDMFHHRRMIRSKLPWRRVKSYDCFWQDDDEAALRHYLEKVYGIAGAHKVDDAIDTLMTRNKIHPIREYLKATPWDGRKRLDTMFIDYLGVIDNAYSRTIARKMMVGAVTRVFRPGIKFDNVVVLTGEEGKMKSMFIEKIGMQWYSSSLTTVVGKEAMEQIQGSWIIEMGELTVLSKAEQSAIKNFISKKEDSFRPSYGHNTVYRPRQCIFIGTTNKQKFLKGIGGDRRFWPVEIDFSPAQLKVNEMDTDVVAQLWAEAYHLYKQGEPLYLSEELFMVAREVQEEFTEVDERAEVVREYLDLPVPENWYDMDWIDRRGYVKGEIPKPAKTFVRDRITTREIWTECFGRPVADMWRKESDAIFFIMDHMKGWKKVKTTIRIPGLATPQKGYCREDVSKKWD